MDRPAPADGRGIRQAENAYRTIFRIPDSGESLYFRRPFVIRPLRRSIFAVLVTAAACTGTTPPDDVVDRDTFISTYVSLRVAALHGDGELTDAQRVEVLGRHGVHEDELVGFVDAHGRDVQYMRNVWDEVEARLDATRALPDSIR